MVLTAACTWPPPELKSSVSIRNMPLGDGVMKLPRNVPALLIVAPALSLMVISKLCPLPISDTYVAVVTLPFLVTANAGAETFEPSIFSLAEATSIVVLKSSNTHFKVCGIENGEVPCGGPVRNLAGDVAGTNTNQSKSPERAVARSVVLPPAMFITASLPSEARKGANSLAPHVPLPRP